MNLRDLINFYSPEIIRKPQATIPEEKVAWSLCLHLRYVWCISSQLTFTCSKSTIETLEKDVEYV